MSNTYEIVRSVFEPTDSSRQNKEGAEVNDYRVRFVPISTVSASTADEALDIAKRLGHPCPVIGPWRGLGEQK
jgi:hypothetical protein